MSGWAVSGVELPFGREDRTWWMDGGGHVGDVPLDGVERLPGRYVLRGMVDCHAHPAVAMGGDGPEARSAAGARQVLLEWARAGVVVVRDVGSPAGVTLDIGAMPGLPYVMAAGRFLAPSGRYFPELLVDPVPEDQLVEAALGEVARGASWVKIIADFPGLPDWTAPEPTYTTALVAAVVDAVHAAGARVAAHSTIWTGGELVEAGVDSIEHGSGLDLDSLRVMAELGTAWTPTLCAVTKSLDDPDTPDERRVKILEMQDRLRQLLPEAVRLGVPVLAGTDVVGTIAEEVRLLFEHGLSPQESLAAASTWPRQFLGLEAPSPDIVTYDHDPRDNPAVLSTPAAVVVSGIRVR